MIIVTAIITSVTASTYITPPHTAAAATVSNVQYVSYQLWFWADKL